MKIQVLLRSLPELILRFSLQSGGESISGGTFKGTSLKRFCGPTRMDDYPPLQFPLVHNKDLTVFGSAWCHFVPVQPVLNYISPALKPGLLFYHPFLLHQMSYLVKRENKQQNGSRGGEERILKVVKSDLEKMPMDPL